MVYSTIETACQFLQAVECIGFIMIAVCTIVGVGALIDWIITGVKC